MRIAAKIVLFFSAAIFAACGSEGNNKASSSGAAYEIFITATQSQWDGAIGDTLRGILLEPVEMINRVEPSFDLYYVQPATFNGLFLRHKNLIVIKTGGEFTQPRMATQNDIYATPQTIVYITGPNDQSVTDYMSEHRNALVTFFNAAERDRFLAQGKKYNEKTLQSHISEKFGFNMTVPRGYMLKNEKQDFLWMSMEHRLSSQGVVIYSYPYTGKENFTVDSLLIHRNAFVSLIPGQNAGSYMITGDMFTPRLKHLRIHGRYWAELRGFWDVHRDFMGGPFVSYSTVDLENRRVVTLDFYVFSPKEHQRNYLRQLENLVYSVSFPGDMEIRNSAAEQ